MKNMVKKGSIMDDFDSIRYQALGNPAVAVAATTTTEDTELELYDKSLIMTEKWDKLPVLEKVNAQFIPIAAIGTYMEARTLNAIRLTVDIFNCEEDDIDTDHVIDSYIYFVSQDAEIVYACTQDHTERDFNVPLRNKITFRVTLYCDGAVANSDFDADQVLVSLFLHIDWVKYSPEQLKDWILKEIFIDQ